MKGTILVNQLRCSAILAVAIAATTLTGCKPDPAVQKGEIIGRGNKSPEPPPGASLHEAPGPQLPTGDATGTVTFAGTPPPAATIDTSMDPACSMGGGAPFKAEQYIVNNGKLANVFVYVKSGPEAAMLSGVAGQPPVILDQKGCRYMPHVIGVQQGGYVEFHNSDPTMHNIHTMPTDVGNQTIDVSQGPKGAPQSKQFLKPELMIPVRCNNHPWMNAFINVSPTPFFAVTDATGHFSLNGLPPGDYVLGAVHEKLGEKTLNVHVDSKATAHADFGFSLK